MSGAFKLQLTGERIQKDRPYSWLDVFNNMHGAVKKSEVVKCLDRLAKAGELTLKLNGKQKVLVAAVARNGSE